MIPLKTASVPAPSCKTLRIAARSLHTAARVTRYTLMGMCMDGRRLVPAERSERAGDIRINDCRGLFEAEGTVFRASPTGVARYPEEDVLSGAGGTLKSVCTYWDEQGTRTFYLLWEKGMTMVTPDLSGKVSGMVGGNCMTVHRERLFIGRESTLEYSAPLSPTTFSLDVNDTGKLELAKGGGDILALLSFKGDLYCFRRYELLRIRADANDLNFSLERLPFDGRQISEGSIALCGSYFAFQTERGIVVSEGNSCKLVFSAEFGLTLGGSSAGRGGKYYAKAKLGETPCVFVYDPAGENYFLDVDATYLVGALDGVYFVHGSDLYCLKAGDGETEETLGLEIDMTAESGKRRRLEGVTVYGAGEFVCKFSTDEDKAEVTAQAGKRADLMRLVSGRTLAVTVAAKGAVLDGIALHFREEDKWSSTS